MSATIHPDWHSSQPPELRVRRFTVDEYHRLGAAGVLAEAERVELLEGWIVPKMNRNPRHDATVELAHESIRPLLASPWRVRVQSAVTTTDSEPEPDLAVVFGSIRAHVSHHPYPQEIGMVVEVSDSSLAQDQTVKGRLYARAGIAEYWIINLIDSRVEVYTDPSADPAVPGYRQRTEFGMNESVPLVIAGQPLGALAVRDLIA